MHHPTYSVIVPVYNRPDEVSELLQSLTQQTFHDFEVVVVEDGSTLPCDTIVDQFRDKLVITYVTKPNSGPGPSRNVGFKQARGQYFVVFDSDCIIPPNYFSVVHHYLQLTPLDAWGGPDKGHESFTAVQQAMAYTMSSVLTTGGIRGNKNQAAQFQPRSFNMGIARHVYEKTQGFQFTRLAEDIELSIRMRKLGFRVGLIVDAFVYHKRRTNLQQFFKQVANFGRGRVRVGKVHRGEVKLTHWFPTVFMLGLWAWIISFLIFPPLAYAASVGVVLYCIALLVDGWRVSRNLSVALLTIPAAFTQLIGYGWGFLSEWFKTYITYNR